MKTQNKNKKKESIQVLSIIFFLILFTSFSVSAITVIPIPISYDDSPSTGQGGGCKPPIEFARENKCSLRYYSKNSVNTFSCGSFTIEGDCEGNVISYEKQTLGNDEVSIIGIGILIIVLIVLIVLIRFYNSTLGGLYRGI